MFKGHKQFHVKVNDFLKKKNIFLKQQLSKNVAAVFTQKKDITLQNSSYSLDIQASLGATNYKRIFLCLFFTFHFRVR